MGERKVKFMSIKVRLIVVPLIIVLIGILGMTAISSYLTRESIMTGMREDGINMSKQLVERLEENTKSIQMLEDALDESILSSAKTIKLNEENLNSSFF